MNSENHGWNYRNYVGPEDRWDTVAAIQFNILTYLGLREHHRLLDIGCGSLRAGRLFIPYLLPRRYYGVEPNKWLVEEGIKHELGDDIIRLKKPHFLFDENFSLSEFGVEFDYVIAQSIFTHASQKQISRCLSEVKKVLHQDGVFIANFEMGRENYEGDEWVYPGYVTYTLEKLMNLVRMQELSAFSLDWEHPGYHTWIAILPSEYNGWCKPLELISVKRSTIKWGQTVDIKTHSPI